MYWTDDPAADAERWYCDQQKREEEEWDEVGEAIARERYQEKERSIVLSPTNDQENR